MGFSSQCSDKNGKSLWHEFLIHDQFTGLSDDHTPYSISELRNVFIHTAYKDKLEDGARDAISDMKSLVKSNLDYYVGPEHPDCPSCQCKRNPPPTIFGLDIDQCKRFLSIPLERVWRASGGY